MNKSGMGLWFIEGNNLNFAHFPIIYQTFWHYVLGYTEGSFDVQASRNFKVSVSFKDSNSVNKMLQVH